MPLIRDHEIGIYHPLGPPPERQLVGRSSEEDPVTLPHAQKLNIYPKPLRGELLIREAVLLTICNPSTQHCERLEELSLNQWNRLLRWLDFSGLALYFFDRIVGISRQDSLPPYVLARLRQNVSDNAERTQGMIAESIAIQQDFQDSRLRYSILKGLSLWPSSVPRPELRSQFDLDFLVAAESAPAARNALERRGYRLYAISGRSWEFKRNEKPGFSHKDLYKDLQSWAVELHIEPGGSSVRSPLERLEWCVKCGFNMPVLSPVDLFIGQGFHAYKHICSEFMRAAHLVEFRRHVLFRRDDYDFWKELHRSASANPQASVALGVATLLATQVMDDFAPEALEAWTVRRLPRPALLWCQMYGHQAVLGGFPGSKLYLLLQKELEGKGIQSKRSVQQSLLPSRFPPPVIRAFPNEKYTVRLSRYRMQMHLIFQRLRFHLAEGLRYAWELHRWRRNMNRATL